MKIFKLSFISLFILFTACLDNSSSGYDDTEDLAFLEEYAQRNGVVTTETGLMYRIIEEGEGEKPTATSIVLAKMEGSSIDGQQSVNTFEGDHPSIVVLESNFLGYQEGFQLMNIGSMYEMVFPTELAFGDGRVIHFERIKLLNTQEGFIEDYSQQEDVTTTETGLRYRVIEEGDGEKPGENSTVVVNYKGTLMNGFEFDSGESATFNLGGANPPIDGFTEGLQLMSPGSTYEFLIPPDIGFGDNSPGYPGAVTIFEVDLIEIQ